MSQQLNGHSYATIGMHLVKKMPEVARAIIDSIPASSGVDICLIPEYFQKYIELTGLPVESIRLSRNQNAKNHRQLFTAAMLKVYHPDVYDRPNLPLKTVKGFQNQLKKCFHSERNRNMPAEIQRIKVFITAYDDFRRDALIIHSQLIKGGDHV